MSNKNLGSAILVLIFVLLVLFLLHLIKKKFKTLKLPCVFFVSGAVKSGKTLLSVHLGIKEYKKALRSYNIKKFFVKLLFSEKYNETYKLVDEYLENNKDCKYSDIRDDLKDYFPPMLYSNIALANVKYNPLTIDIINRQVRIPNKSVVLIDEVSLLADSQLFKDKDINNKLMIFYKLFGHYSHGGKCIADSQSVADNHYSIRRCMGSMLYIHERIKYPFFSVLKVRELMYSDDDSVVNTFNEDVEDTLKMVFILNTTYKKYDCYCYSVFTDYQSVYVKYDTDIKSVKDNLKVYNIVTLNDFIEKMNKNIMGKYPHLPLEDYKSLQVGDYYVNDEGVVVRKCLESEEDEELENEEN